MSRTRRTTNSAAAIAFLAITATTGCGIMNHGKATPASVEKKAHTLTRQTLDAIHPVIGSARTSVDRADWGKCPTETPGVHRFEYAYTLKLEVPQDRSEAVMAAAKAHFVKQGYDLDLPDPKTARVGGTEKNSSWWVGVGVNNDKTSMFISVDSDCVGTSHDPKTAS
ncbi:hypothetical protein [Streptomyces sp. NBC_00448]|uniref:hypothetical protein n=1 Tax=Streptomyces sp. NBC_00448 TaxID=2903652 RepID=UPI002E1B414E